MENENSSKSPLEMRFRSGVLCKPTWHEKSFQKRDIFFTLVRLFVLPICNLPKENLIQNTLLNASK